MTRLSCFKDWMIKRRHLILIITIVLLVTIGGISIVKRSGYTQVYKYLLNAEVSVLNDDLKGALVSLEKAYELKPINLLENKIEKINKLIDSKSSFMRGLQAEEGENFETAYYYYEQVDEIDEERYDIAQQKLLALANQVVDEIYEQAEQYYDNHLYLMIIKKLESALKYRTRMEETQSKINYYQEILYQYYVDKSIDEANEYCDDPLFYNLFTQSLDHALGYATSSEKKEAIRQLKQQLVQTQVDYYLTLATEASENGDVEVTNQYMKQILVLDPNHSFNHQLLNQ